jgi:RNA polymerase sigma-70 factor, ECF subfamily
MDTPEPAVVAARTAHQIPDSPGPADDPATVAALRAGDESAFAGLVDRLSPAMLRLAMSYVPTRVAAEEAVQETWLAVLEGLGRFEGRSTLKTWIFRILMNRAMTRGQRERRTVPFSALFDPAGDAGEPSVDPDRFQGHHDRFPGGWARPPRPWEEIPETRLLSTETMAHVQSAIDRLPPGQRAVITLRDISGWTSGEVCNALGLSETNQRVLLHRARSRVRRDLEEYLDDKD